MKRGTRLLHLLQILQNQIARKFCCTHLSSSLCLKLFKGQFGLRRGSMLTEEGVSQRFLRRTHPNKSPWMCCLKQTCLWQYEHMLRHFKALNPGARRFGWSALFEWALQRTSCCHRAEPEFNGFVNPQRASFICSDPKISASDWVALGERAVITPLGEKRMSRTYKAYFAPLSDFHLSWLCRLYPLWPACGVSRFPDVTNCCWWLLRCRFTAWSLSQCLLLRWIRLSLIPSH